MTEPFVKRSRGEDKIGFEENLERRTSKQKKELGNGYERVQPARVRWRAPDWPRKLGWSSSEVEKVRILIENLIEKLGVTFWGL